MFKQLLFGAILLVLIAQGHLSISGPYVTGILLLVYVIYTKKQMQKNILSEGIHG